MSRHSKLSHFPYPNAFTLSIKRMEKGYNPEQTPQSNNLSVLHQALRDGQAGFISFEDVRLIYRSWAISVLEQSKERQSLFEFNMHLTFPEETSVTH
jgi:hypothetical protein